MPQYAMLPMTYMLPPIAGAYGRPLVEAEQQARYDAGMKRIGNIADQITNDLNAGYAADMARRPQQVQDMADAMVAREYPRTGPRLRKDLVPNPMANRFPAPGQVPMQLQLPPIQSLPSPEDAGRDPMAANTDAIYGGWGSTAGYAPGVGNWRNSRSGQAQHLANITMGQNQIRDALADGESLRQFKGGGDGPQIPILPGVYQLRGGIVNPTLRKQNTEAKLAAINASRVARMAEGRAAYQAAQQSRAAAEEAKFAARNPGYRQAVDAMMPGVALAREKMANDLAIAKAANETSLGLADKNIKSTSQIEANKSIVDQITSLVAMYQTPNLTPLERRQIQSQIDALRGQLGGSTPVSTQPRPVPTGGMAQDVPPTNSPIPGDTAKFGEFVRNIPLGEDFLSLVSRGGYGNEHLDQWIADNSSSVNGVPTDRGGWIFGSTPAEMERLNFIRNLRGLPQAKQKVPFFASWSGAYPKGYADK